MLINKPPDEDILMWAIKCYCAQENLEIIDVQIKKDVTKTSTTNNIISKKEGKSND